MKKKLTKTLAVVDQPRLVQLFGIYADAAHAVCACAMETYPQGSIIVATLGGHEIRGEVTDHNDAWWSRPGTLEMKNLATGKIRQVNPLSPSQNVRILSLPNVKTQAPT